MGMSRSPKIRNVGTGVQEGWYSLENTYKNMLPKGQNHCVSRLGKIAIFVILTPLSTRGLELHGIGPGDAILPCLS